MNKDFLFSYQTHTSRAASTMMQPEGSLISVPLPPINMFAAVEISSPVLVQGHLVKREENQMPLREIMWCERPEENAINCVALNNRCS